MERSISFVIATNGKRDFIRQTVANLHEIGRVIGDYEIIIAGNVERVPDQENVVLVSDPILPPPALPRFVWGTGLKRASKRWTACVADDMTLSESWARGFVEFDAAGAQVVFGRLLKADGIWERQQSVEEKSILAAVRPEVWRDHPLLEAFGEDAIWGRELEVCGVPRSTCPEMVWIHHGISLARGGIGSSYAYTREVRAQHNKERAARLVPLIQARK